MVFQIQAGIRFMKIIRQLCRYLYPGLLAVIVGCTSTDIRKGTISLELGDYTMAIRFFSRVLERQPDHFAARLGMGKALLQKAVDNKNDSISWRQAILHLEAARTLNSGVEVHTLLSQVWSERGSKLLHSGDTIGALEALTRAIADDPEYSEPFNLAGIVYFRTGRAQKARMLFERAVQIDSTNPSPLFNLGMVYWEQEKFTDAHDLWMRALTLSPRDEEFLYWFAAAEKKLRVSGAVDDAGEQ